MNVLDRIININGTNNYAYVVMVINNDIYASASIVFAESIRKIGCLGDLVILVDKFISKQTLNVIKKFYNKIILIESIEINNINPIQKIILSKVNAFKLTEYKKIFLIDVDTILFTNIDKIFIDSQTPSISHIENEINYGFILVEPSQNMYNKSIRLINKYREKLEQDKKPFNFIIGKLFKKINKLNINLSRDNFDNSDGIQYTINKPFLMSSNLSIENRMGLDHFKVWFSYLANIINKYPEIKKAKFLQEPITVSKYFLASMSRFIVNFVKLYKKKKLNQIIQIYGQEKYKNLDYYHLDISKEYSNEFINFNSNLSNIRVFLKYLSDITNINFNKFNNCIDSKELIKMITNTETDANILDNFLNQYIKIFPNTFVVLEIDNMLSEPSELKNNIIYTKQINTEGICLKNILFNLCQNYTYSQRLLFLSQIEDKTHYTIWIKIYETISQIDLFDTNKNTNLFVFFDKNSKIRISSIFFNPNTIDMIKNKLCIGISSLDGKSINRVSLISQIYFQTLKKWIYNTYSENQIENILLINNLENNYKLIDNNSYKISEIKKINNNKIFFVSIIFLKASQYKNILNDQDKITTMIYDQKNYWEFEGIKFTKEKIEL